ncbi:MAG: FG-GAP repeat protein, partial [Acidobacteria bacterium]|nr:FG-GAP repeat protein [Acidobacteriota bacterium]
MNGHRWTRRRGGIVPGARFRSVVVWLFLLLLPIPGPGGHRARAVEATATPPLTSQPAWTAEIDQAAAFFGAALAPAGDVNGDGYADVIVGAYLYDNDQGNAGKACVYTGSAAGLSIT